ncbi:dihydroorotate dehydrogenase [Myxococcota bacterium]|nr:dihydroorotate dehydrogenase [Myxococcota bacterium]MBU1381526.1 dihydroorotate dehydrogenase [Myxococcota bacterium]MBU1496545.1 dihydroorotate dehydrogenase [Myxococcota bacterium]
MKTSVEIGGIDFTNPFMTASGTSGHGSELSDFLDFNKIGAFVTKGISLLPFAGNKPPRICEVRGGMINAIGLENPGVEVFLNQLLPDLQKVDCKIVVNFYGKTETEYFTLAEMLGSATGIDALEMNISCPNVEKGGLLFGTEPELSGHLVRECTRLSKKPVFVKLAPAVSSIVSIGKACADAGAAALTCANSWPATDIDISTGKFKLAPGRGGMSGPAILPLTLLKVSELYTFFKDTVPVIASGGIMTGEDTIKFFMAGARAVQIGTATFTNPRAVVSIMEETLELLVKMSIDDINAVRGKAVKP